MIAIVANTRFEATDLPIGLSGPQFAKILCLQAATISAIEKLNLPAPCIASSSSSAELRRLAVGDFLLVLIPLFVAVEVFVFVLRRQGSIPDSVRFNDLITTALFLSRRR